MKRLLGRYSLLPIIFSFIFLGSNCPKDPINHIYYLAHHRSGTPNPNQIFVFHSPGGVAWTDGNYPVSSANHSTETTNGVSIAAGGGGLTNLVIWRDDGGNIQGVTGVGTEWGNGNTLPTLEGVGVADSDPMAAYAGDNKYLVTFSSGGKLILRQLDHRWAEVTVHPGAANIFGTPAIAVHGNQVLLAWQESETPTTLHMASGELSLPDINWGAEYTISAGGGGRAFFQYPTLAHDGSRFVLGVVNRGVTMSLFVIRTSVNPIGANSWENLTAKIFVIDTIVRLAARSDELLVIARATTAEKSGIFKIVGNIWTDLDFAPLNNLVPGHFTVVANRP